MTMDKSGRRREVPGELPADHRCRTRPQLLLHQQGTPPYQRPRAAQCSPETVQAEVLRKSRQDERFRAAEQVWRKLTPPLDADTSRRADPRSRSRCPSPHPATHGTPAEVPERPGRDNGHRTRSRRRRSRRHGDGADRRRPRGAYGHLRDQSTPSAPCHRPCGWVIELGEHPHGTQACSTQAERPRQAGNARHLPTAAGTRRRPTRPPRSAASSRAASAGRAVPRASWSSSRRSTSP